MLKFQFTTEMTQAIAAALENMPYKFAAPILMEMQRQIQAQSNGGMGAPLPDQARAGNGDERR